MKSQKVLSITEGSSSQIQKLMIARKVSLRLERMNMLIQNRMSFHNPDSRGARPISVRQMNDEEKLPLIRTKQRSVSSARSHVHLKAKTRKLRVDSSNIRTNWRKLPNCGNPESPGRKIISTISRKISHTLPVPSKLHENLSINKRRQRTRSCLTHLLTPTRISSSKRHYC